MTGDCSINSSWLEPPPAQGLIVGREGKADKNAGGQQSYPLILYLGTGEDKSPFILSYPLICYLGTGEDKLPFILSYPFINYLGRGEDRSPYLLILYLGTVGDMLPLSCLILLSSI